MPRDSAEVTKWQSQSHGEWLPTNMLHLAIFYTRRGGCIRSICYGMFRSDFSKFGTFHLLIQCCPRSIELSLLDCLQLGDPGIVLFTNSLLRAFSMAIAGPDLDSLTRGDAHSGKSLPNALSVNTVIAEYNLPMELPSIIWRALLMLNCSRGPKLGDNNSVIVSLLWLLSRRNRSGAEQANKLRNRTLG
jgi:hypothetical protein